MNKRRFYGLLIIIVGILIIIGMYFFITSYNGKFDNKVADNIIVTNSENIALNKYTTSYKFSKANLVNVDGISNFKFTVENVTGKQMQSRRVKIVFLTEIGNIIKEEYVEVKPLMKDEASVIKLQTTVNVSICADVEFSEVSK